ncbi:hypothetical protein [Burkholderia cepacia]|uniref:hypothetical protein n=1 Tax=Burkholderia cepacia TaxID=292 RepID=UPI002AB759FE|nr:hypothetical protein [Burkholderia cepacia]
MTRNPIINSTFAHCIDETWHLSAEAAPAVPTIQAYRAQVQQAYGHLRGVKFVGQGIDYSHFVRLDGRLVPVMLNYDVSTRFVLWATANRPIGYDRPIVDSPVQVRLVRCDGKARIRMMLYDVLGPEGRFTRLGAYVNDADNTRHTIDIPLVDDASLEKAVFYGVSDCLEKIEALERRAAGLPAAV